MATPDDLNEKSEAKVAVVVSRLVDWMSHEHAHVTQFYYIINIQQTC